VLGTGDDTLLLSAVASPTTSLLENGLLDEQQRETLAIEAYDILKHYVSDPRRRSWAVQARYERAPGLVNLIRLVDEATLAFLRGYFTAGFALMLIVLERYLRTVSGWRPGDPDITFAALRRAVARFEFSGARMIARGIVDALYSRYEALTPPAFLFNRHGLLHGLRNASAVDEMNCARIFFLLDLLAACEGPGASEIVVGLGGTRHESICSALRIMKRWRCCSGTALRMSPDMVVAEAVANSIGRRVSHLARAPRPLVPLDLSRRSAGRSAHLVSCISSTRLGCTWSYH
jgi:hypothetical protein